jgi:hypothetical protein
LWITNIHTHVTKLRWHFLFLSWEITYLTFINKLFGGSFHSLHLLDLCDLFMTGPVVPALTPDINVLTAIAGMPLDLLQFILGAGLGLLALCMTPHHG